jgi:molybdopterin converting factor small subunit
VKIKVLYFAQLRDAAQAGERSVEVTAPVTAGSFASDHLALPEFTHCRGLKIRYAVNDEFVSPDHLISAPCTLALLPPVAGG